MNTFMRTQDRVKVQNWLASDASDTCEHVLEDKALAYAVRGESDSFGPLSRFVLCRECDERAQAAFEEELVAEVAAQNAELVYCEECSAHVPWGTTREWHAYDQRHLDGVLLCAACWGSPKHVARMGEDRRMEADAAAHQAHYSSSDDEEEEDS